MGKADVLLHELLKYVQEQFAGSNEVNRHFQTNMAEGCQNMYTEVKAIEASIDALNQSTVQLAHKHIDTTNSLNLTT